MSNINKAFKIQVIVALNNKILLLRTNKKRGEFWQNITGSMEENENFKQCALREFSEETGITIISEINQKFKAIDSEGNKLNGELIELPFINKFVDQTSRFIEEHCYLCHISRLSFLSICTPQATNDIIIKLDAIEHNKYQWVDINEIKECNYKYISNYLAFKSALPFLSLF
ncbi:MAG: NUDIX domain-containing protein [Oligoflexia bacterium]|nr:NUDIX domain-containing protein [Oligoflexia bacterium]